MADRWRSLRVFEGGGVVGRIDGTAVVSFASNDAFGLSQHPSVKAAAVEAIDRWGTGSGSARVVAGSRKAHEDLEVALADWKDCERALLFPTGYMANVGVLSAFGGAEVTMFSDALNHASIIDGCRLSRSHVVVYPHLDMIALENGLRDATGRKIVVSEMVFSMDGDVAPITDLIALCDHYGALLVVDEAHDALGVAASVKMGDHVIRVGTLSKMLGSIGGFVAGSTDVIDLCINRSRSFLFTTSLPPADVAAALAALLILRSDEGHLLSERLQAHIDRVRPGWRSAIIPVLIGGEAEALEASQRLFLQGLFVPAIRPPTVPSGTSRLRISLSAAHDASMIDSLLAGLCKGGLR
jgi:8-amino-7-oxononanoate synthase